MENKTIMLIAEEDCEALYEKLSDFAENAKDGDMLNCIEMKLQIVEFTPLRSEKQHYGLVSIYKACRRGYVLYLDTEFGFVTEEIPLLPCKADARDNRAIWEYMAEFHPHFEKYAAIQWELYDASSFDDWSLSSDQLGKLRAFFDRESRSLYLDQGHANMFIDFVGIVSPKKGIYYNVMAMFWHNATLVAIVSIPETNGALYPITIDKELNVD